LHAADEGANPLPYARPARRTLVTRLVAVGVLLGCFLVVAFRIFDVIGAPLTSQQMVVVFALASLLFLAAATAILWSVTAMAKPQGALGIEKDARSSAEPSAF